MSGGSRSLSSGGSRSLSSGGGVGGESETREL